MKEVPEWLPVSCESCRHFNPRNRSVCAVFPDVIPHPIQSGQFDHRKRFPGDGGLGYEPTKAFLDHLTVLEDEALKKVS